MQYKPGELSFLLHKGLYYNSNSKMIGNIYFQSEMEITKELENNSDVHQLAREQGTVNIVESMLEWIKGNDPIALESYINMEAKDLVILWTAGKW